MTAAGQQIPVIVAVPEIASLEALHASSRTQHLRCLAGQTMGTLWSARFFADPEHDDCVYVEAIERELQDIVAQMSHWLPESDLSCFNRAAAGCWQTLQPAFFQVLERALEIARETDGAYDPTLGAIVEEWGFGPLRKPKRPPASDVLAELQAERCGWQHVELDKANRRARHIGGLNLDLSAIAKGFAVDRISAVLRSAGVRSHLVEIGGELRAHGVKSSREPWWIAIEPPADAALAPGFPEIRVALSGWSIATSGDYRRYFDLEGQRCAHTIDPRTAVSVRNGLASVSVLHHECAAADAYSTALMVLGPEDGRHFAERSGLAALFVVRRDDGFRIVATEAFCRMIEG